MLGLERDNERSFSGGMWAAVTANPEGLSNHLARVNHDATQPMIIIPCSRSPGR